MRQPDLQMNLQTTLEDVRSQLGIETGGPTGVCSLVVLGAFTGAHLNYNNAPSTSSDLYELEQEYGLYRAEVHSPGVFVIDALRTLLDQNRISFNGVIAHGRVPAAGGRTAPHAVAVVVDENLRPFGVVDSLVKGAFRPTPGESWNDDVTGAGLAVQGRFMPNKPYLYLALDEAGRNQFRGRTVELSSRVSANLIGPHKR